MLRRPSNLALVAGLTVIAAVALFLGESGLPAQSLFAMPLVLFVPGYAISLALFRRNTITTAERLLFALGLSLSVVAAGGLIVNYTGWGLELNTWLVWIVGVSLAGSAIALLKRREPLVVVTRSSFTWPARRDLVLFGFAGVSVLAALALARMPAPAQGSVGYTALWMVPNQTAHPDAVELGVISSEFTTTRYDLQLKRNDQLIREWKDIVLRPGDRWTANASLPSTSGSEKVEAFLYRASNPTQLYRYALVQSQAKGN
jgi:Protein of unknown function (DUF1616)